MLWDLWSPRPAVAFVTYSNSLCFAVTFLDSKSFQPAIHLATCCKTCCLKVTSCNKLLQGGACSFWNNNLYQHGERCCFSPQGAKLLHRKDISQQAVQQTSSYTVQPGCCWTNSSFVVQPGCCLMSCTMNFIISCAKRMLLDQLCNDFHYLLCNQDVVWPVVQ